MVYANYDNYTSLYGDDLPETDFDRLCWDASRQLDYFTTGADGVQKLVYAFPDDPLDAEAVRRCVCELIHTMWHIEKIEEEARRAVGFIETSDGMHGKVISSMSAGNESVSFANTPSAIPASRYDAAVTDPAARERLTRETVMSYLRGAKDARGVNLLYMGEYPV